MKSKIFDNGLVVKHRKSAIILESEDGKEYDEEKFVYEFSEEGFKDFASYIEEAANEAWSNIVPKEADNEGSDYGEYYDRKYDNNGSLYIITNGISIMAPHTSVDTLYQFNKAKIQSFIYDLQKALS